MTVTEAVRQRRSIRAFLPTPVPEAVLREVLDAARWAPSGSNIQAWKIVAVAGEERDAVVRMALGSMGGVHSGPADAMFRSVGVTAYWRPQEGHDGADTPTGKGGSA